MKPSSIQLTEQSTLWSVRLEKWCYLDFQDQSSTRQGPGPNYNYRCVIIPWLVRLPTLEPRATLGWSVLIPNYKYRCVIIPWSGGRPLGAAGSAGLLGGPAGLDSIAASLSTNSISIRRQDPNIYSDTETRALSRLGCYSGGSAGLLGRPRVFTIQK